MNRSNKDTTSRTTRKILFALHCSIILSLAYGRAGQLHTDPIIAFGELYRAYVRNDTLKLLLRISFDVNWIIQLQRHCGCSNEIVGCW